VLVPSARAAAKNREMSRASHVLMISTSAKSA
jgi:hypothetical protein